MTTVVSVEVTPDLKYCKAYISVYGTQQEQEETFFRAYKGDAVYKASAGQQAQDTENAGA